jgi:hypothetical protein
MRYAYPLILALLLSACDEKSGAGGEDAAADVAADAAPAVDAADAASATDVANDVTAVVCTAAQIAACDDKNPCTQDSCSGPDGACSHAGVASPCDDGDPCSVEDTCASGICKGKIKDCDDKSPCTIDNCQLDGSCTHVHNQHEDCLPLIVVDQPPRALRLKSVDATVLVAGKLVNQNSQAKTLTVNGKDVAFAANGAFSTSVPLQFGAQTLVLEVTDVFGGKRLRVQGVHWSPLWQAGDQPIGAGSLRVMTDLQAWLPSLLQDLSVAQFMVPLAFAPAKVPVKLGWSGQMQEAANLTALPMPLTVAEAMAATPTTDPGTPLRQACMAVDPGLNPAGATVQWTVTHDVLNAALRAAWLGGALVGDVSPIGDGLAPGFTVKGQIHADMPWLLQDCPGTAPILLLTDLRLDIAAYLGDELFATAETHIAIAVTPKYTWQNGILQLGLGQTQTIQLDLATGSKDLQATDVHVAMEKALKEKSLPLLLAEWSKAPLVEIDLPHNVGNVLNWTWLNAVQELPGLLRADGSLSMP